MSAVRRGGVHSRRAVLRALGLAGLLGAVPARRAVAARPPRPPAVSLVELRVRSLDLAGQPLSKTVRVAHPKGWEGDVDEDGRAVHLYGPQGEGEILLAAVGHPSELGAYLDELRQSHPGASPSPPAHAKVLGIDPERGERATRFEITGTEVGEMMMIERGGVIVLFAAVVAPEAWPPVRTQLERCYPTVEVAERVVPRKK